MAYEIKEQDCFELSLHNPMSGLCKSVSGQARETLQTSDSSSRNNIFKTVVKIEIPMGQTSISTVSRTEINYIRTKKAWMF